MTALTTASLWAKLERGNDGQPTYWHSLVAHSADVAAVVETLLDQPTINRRLARAGGRDWLDAPTRARLAALAFLHDIGKANRGFRRRIDPTAPPVGHIDQLAWVFKTDLSQELCGLLGLERMDAWFSTTDNQELWDTLFAHHGRPWATDPANAALYWRREVAGRDRIADPIGDLAPLRVALDRWFADAFLPAPPLSEAPSFHHAFAGLLMLADWLGSDTRFFPFADGDDDASRMDYARAQARKALREVGLIPRSMRGGAQAPGFGDLFAGRAARPIQSAATSPGAHCVVLEAETGAGKTEAALWRFRHLFAAGEVDGLYFALPTRVAATQMFARVKRFRDALFPPDDRPAVVLAVPGQVGADEARGHPLPDFGFEWTDRADEATRRGRWAAEHPKRFLAAQIAVGTVDQVLLAAIATRHAHLRGTALLRHLLVVDEVHASDRYMETLLANLLRGHMQAGGHALLLSATLGAGMHARLLATPCPTLAAAEAVPYPALSWAEAGRAAFHQIPADGKPKQVRLSPVPRIDDPAGIAAMALEAATAGAKVLVVRNTVGAAIATARALEAAAGAAHPALFRVAGVATLHHGRFAPGDRRLLDAEVERSLAPDGAGAPCVVIGTQTLEQSLDLDADLLITDLCPVDVMLQRIGRLHRHARARPGGFAEPRAVVLTPSARDLLPLLRGGQGRHGLGRVYEDPRIIEATWRLLEDKPVWTIPAMNRHLVEHATHPERLAAIEAELRARDGAWADTLDRVYGSTIARAGQARLGLLDREAPFSAFRIPEDEPWATRLGARDRLVTVSETVPGPFGGPLGSLRIPHFLAGDAAAEAVPEVLESGAGGLLFRFGSGLLRYDRFGLRREPN